MSEPNEDPRVGPAISAAENVMDQIKSGEADKRMEEAMSNMDKVGFYTAITSSDIYVQFPLFNAIMGSFRRGVKHMREGDFYAFEAVRSEVDGAFVILGLIEEDYVEYHRAMLELLKAVPKHKRKVFAINAKSLVDSATLSPEEILEQLLELLDKGDNLSEDDRDA